MVKKYLDDTGLAYFFEKLKSIFLLRSEAEEDYSLVDSGSGESVAVDSDSYLESSTISGQSKAYPINLFDAPTQGWIVGTSSTYHRIDGYIDGNNKGTLFVAKVKPNTDYFVSANFYTGMNRFRVALFDDDPRGDSYTGQEFPIGHSSQAVQVNDPTTDQYATINTGSYTWLALGLSTSATATNQSAVACLKEVSSTLLPEPSFPTDIKVVDGIDLLADAEWTQGIYQTNGPIDNTNTKRIRNKTLMPIVPGLTYKLKCDFTRFKITYRVYSHPTANAANLVSSESVTVWLTDEYTFTPVEGKYLAVGMAYVGEETILPQAAKEAKPSCKATGLGIRVSGKNLVDFSPNSYTAKTRCTVVGIADHLVLTRTVASNVAYLTKDIGSPKLGFYTLSKNDTTNVIRMLTYDSNMVTINDTTKAAAHQSETIEVTENAKLLRIYIYMGTSSSGTVGDTATVENLQLEYSSTKTSYEPHYDVVTPIDLQNETLASLPDGTKDELAISSTGAMILTKRVGVFDASSITTYDKHSSIANWFFKDNAISDCDYAKGTTEACGLSNRFTAQPYSNVGNLTDGQFAFGVVADAETKRLVFKCASASTAEEFNTWIANNQTTLYYPLATPQTIDLGYIDMPQIPEGATVSIVANTTPPINISWRNNSSQEIIKKFSVDYIVEEGEDNGWHYRKWSSGVAECWGGFEHNNVAITAAWGALYESTTSFYETFPSGLFNATPDYCGFNWSPAAGSSGILSIELTQGLTNERTQAVYLARNATATVSGVLQVHARGTWR